MKYELWTKKLYVLLSEEYMSSNLTTMVKNICEGGADIIQLREKNKNSKEFLADALKVRKITQKYGTIFIVNDRPDIALLAGADGVHLGEDDIPVTEVRKMLPTLIVGASVNSVHCAIQTQKEGVNYLGVGCLFPSGTKTIPRTPLSMVTKIKENVSLPVFGIGGITIDKIEDVLKAGADGICLAGDIFKYKNIKERVSLIKSKIKAT